MSPLLPPPVSQVPQQDLLDLLDRILPDHYIEPLKAVGPGYELLQAFAKMFERVGLGVYILGVDAQIATAGVGVKADGAVQLFRSSPNTFDTPIQGQAGTASSIVAGAPGGQMRVSGLTNMSAASVGHFLVISGANAPADNGTFLIASFVNSTTVDVVNAAAVIPDANNGFLVWSEITRTVIVKAGTIVTTSKGGRDFATTQDVTFAPDDLGPFNVSVVAVSVGYEWNVTGQVTAADGTVLPGEVDTVKMLVEDPPLGDPTIQVRQLFDINGGSDAALDALGNDRGIVRVSGEDNDAYRNRVRSLPDTISPLAFQRVIDRILRPIGAGFVIIETFDPGYQEAYDGPASIPGTTYNASLFVYDDPRAAYPFRNRWLDENDYRGGVIVVVDNVQPISDTSMAYDDVAADVDATVSSVTGGIRAVCAYDVPTNLGFGALQGGYDGFDLGKQALYKGLHDTLQGIKAAGVSVAVELRGQ